MVYSTAIDDLRSDAAVNCRAFVALMQRAGFNAKIVNTVRDNEKQLALFAQGVTRSKVPTFHAMGVGLAFDICQNVPGHAYDNEAFWQKAGEIGKMIGFSWGWDWSSFREKPHFQWDAHKQYSGSDILSGHRPPIMPIYEEDKDVTTEAFKKLYDEVNPIIASIDDPKLPPSIKPEVQKLLDSGAINGGTPSKVNAKDINLRLETLKAIVVAKR